MRKFLGIIFDDFLLKFIALGMALLLWGYLMGQETHTRQINVPLRLTGAQSGLRQVGKMDNYLTVTVRGRAGVLMSLDKDDFVAEIDLSDLRQRGEHLVTPTVKTQSDAVQIVSFSPMRVMVHLEKVERKE